MDGLVTVLIIYLFFIARPAIILGIVPALPIWLIWTIQKIFRRRLCRVQWAGISTIAIISFVLSFIVFIYLEISFEYSSSMISSPIYDEMQKYEQEVIPLAFQNSLTPPFLRLVDACAHKPQIVCELIASNTLNLWSFHDNFDGFPYSGAITSALVSMLLIILGESIFGVPYTSSTIVESEISILEKNSDADGLLKILESKRHWRFKFDAAEVLAKLGNQKGLQYITNALDSSDKDQREIAKEILADLYDEHGIPALESRSVR